MPGPGLPRNWRFPVEQCGSLRGTIHRVRWATLASGLPMPHEGRRRTCSRALPRTSHVARRSSAARAGAATISPKCCRDVWRDLPEKLPRASGSHGSRRSGQAYMPSASPCPARWGPGGRKPPGCGPPKQGTWIQAIPSAGGGRGRKRNEDGQGEKQASGPPGEGWHDARHGERLDPSMRVGEVGVNSTTPSHTLSLASCQKPSRIERRNRVGPSSGGSSRHLRPWGRADRPFASDRWRPASLRDSSAR